ncbi:hypothetical protein LCGC14_1644990 [marine sediment metagenome]|uniref:Nucleoside 2-deoxyribosyltransferase n=1 Tax=marine sediment metagenome TaxID=412755 RepID=A0A0F9IL13_9ZZZZ
MLQNKKAYMSHSIRGRLGTDATPESMAANNRLAHEAAVLMRCVLPEVHLYVPGENDLLISILYQDGRLKEEDILWGDCEIIRDCDILFAWSPDDFISTGMQIEITFAREHNIPVYIIHDVEALQTWKPEILKYLEKK